MDNARGRRTINIAIVSRNFFGAERRFFRIVAYLQREAVSVVRVRLILNSTLYVVSSRIDWAAEILDRLEAGGQLSVIPDSLSHGRYLKRPSLLLLSVFSKAPMHSVLRSRPAAYLRALLGGDVGIEVTSREEADSVAKLPPYFVLRRVGAFRCVSPAVHWRFVEALTTRFGERRALRISRAIVVAETPFFDPHAISSPSESKENLVVSASRFVGRKNVVMIARALASVLPSLPGWRAAILGRGDDEVAIRSILGALIEEGRVDVCHAPGADPYLARSRIYISMIEPDNYPSQSILEALHLQNALILSDTGQSSRFLDEGRNGRLVPLDESSLASALLELAGNERGLDEMGVASAGYASRHFSASAHVYGLLSLYFSDLPAPPDFPRARSVA